jgi:hypothetical protein
MSAVRRALGALWLALGRDPGVTLIETDRWTLAEELWSFGEDSLYPVALQLSDEDIGAPVAPCRRTPLEGQGPFQRRGGRAGGVGVIEGTQRPLARKRRRPQANRLRFEQTPEERYAEISRIEESASFDERWR